MAKEKDCKDCKSYIVGYADGYVLKDFTYYKGEISELPTEPDENKFWVYKDCKKNAKKLQFINLSDDCKGFDRKVAAK